MIPIEQIRALSLSYIYGIFFAFTYKINNKYLVSNIMFFRIILIFLFILDHILLYFILISLINNGIIHLYFLFLFIFGIISYIYLFDKQKLNKIDLDFLK